MLVANCLNEYFGYHFVRLVSLSSDMNIPSCPSKARCKLTDINMKKPVCVGISKSYMYTKLSLIRSSILALNSIFAQDPINIDEKLTAQYCQSRPG